MFSMGKIISPITVWYCTFKQLGVCVYTHSTHAYSEYSLNTVLSHTYTLNTHWHTTQNTWVLCAHIANTHSNENHTKQTHAHYIPTVNQRTVYTHIKPTHIKITKIHAQYANTHTNTCTSLIGICFRGWAPGNIQFNSCGGSSLTQ